MTIYIIYAIIILVTIILYFLVKDKKEFIKKVGTTTLISGIITLALGLISSIVLNTYLANFNITRITALLFQKFIHNSVILITIGGVEILISKLIEKKKKKLSPSSN